MDRILDIPKLYTAIAEWLSCVTAILIYRRCVGKRPKDFVMLFAGLIVLFIVILRIQLFCQEHNGIPWLLAMTAAVFVIVLSMKLALRLKWSGALYVGARVFIWAELAAALEWQVFYFYTFGVGRFVEAPLSMAFAIAFYLAVYAVFFFVESHELPQELEPGKVTASRPQILFAWVITLLLFALSNLSYLLRNTPFSGTEITDIFYIRTLSDIVGVVAAQMFHLQKRDMERREENAAFRNVLRNQYIQFQESKDNIELINRKYHDLKHQLQVLRETTDDSLRAEYIDEIQEGIEKYEAENKTGNSVLDTVLTSKQSRCIKESVTMTVVADGALLKRLSVMDICRVFGNAIDNAIEREIKVEDVEKRLIHVTVSQRNSFVCILVENYYEGEAIPDGSFPKTTKKNAAYHGFGLKSIKHTVEKYGGYVNTGVLDDWFRLEIIIPKE